MLGLNPITGELVSMTPEEVAEAEAQIAEATSVGASHGCIGAMGDEEDGGIVLLDLESGELIGADDKPNALQVATALLPGVIPLVSNAAPGIAKAMRRGRVNRLRRRIRKLTGRKDAKSRRRLARAKQVLKRLEARAAQVDNAQATSSVTPAAPTVTPQVPAAPAAPVAPQPFAYPSAPTRPARPAYPGGFNPAQAFQAFQQFRQGFPGQQQARPAMSYPPPMAPFFGPRPGPPARRPAGRPQGGGSPFTPFIQQASRAFNPRSQPKEGTVGSIFPSVWGDSVISGDPTSYWNPELDGDFAVGDDSVDPDDLQFIVAFDAEMAEVEDEDDADYDMEVNGFIGSEDDVEIGNIFRRRRGRLQRIRDRQARLRRRAARASRKGRSRRARRLQRRLSRARDLEKKVTKRLQRRAARRGAGSRAARRLARAGVPTSSSKLPATTASKPSAMEQIAQFIPALPEEGSLCVLPLRYDNKTTYGAALTVGTKTTDSDAKEWKTDSIPYAELQLIGAIIEGHYYGTGGEGLIGIEMTKFAPDGKVQALYDAQTQLFDPNGFLTQTSTPAAASVGFLRNIVIGLRDKGRIERTNKVSGTAKVFAPAQASGTFNFVYSFGAIANVIEDAGAQRSN